MQSDTYRAHIRWLRLRGLSDLTIRERAGTLRRLAAWSGGTPLCDLTEDDLMEWASSLEELGRATRAVYVSHVRSFYGWAYKEHRIAADPAASLPAPKVPAREPRPISEEKLASAVRLCDGRVRAWLVLAGWCGLRACEIAGLRGENIHLADNPPYMLIADTKGQRERTVAVCEYAAHELRRQYLPGEGLCWETWDGRPAKPGLVSGVCNRYLHEQGIPDTLHSLRHRFGTQVQRAVRDVLVTQQLLGHKHPDQTAGYARVADVDKLRAVNGIPAPKTAVPDTSWVSWEITRG